MQFGERIKEIENKYADVIELYKFTQFVIAKQNEETRKFATKRMIEILDNYKGSSGKKYSSDYRAILNWVVGRYNEESQKNGNKYLSSTKDLSLAGNSDHGTYRDTL